MKNVVTNYVNRCYTYNKFYKIPRKEKLYWYLSNKGSEPLRIIHLNHLRPFVLTK